MTKRAYGSDEATLKRVVDREIYERDLQRIEEERGARARVVVERIVIPIEQLAWEFGLQAVEEAVEMIRSRRPKFAEGGYKLNDPEG